MFASSGLIFYIWPIHSVLMRNLLVSQSRPFFVFHLFSFSPSFCFSVDLRVCHKITVTSHLPFCPFSALRKKPHSSTMRFLSRLENEQKIGAILLHLFHATPLGLAQNKYHTIRSLRLLAYFPFRENSYWALHIFVFASWKRIGKHKPRNNVNFCRARFFTDPECKVYVMSVIYISTVAFHASEITETFLIFFF